MDDSSHRCVKIPLVWSAPICDRCGHPAEIFQAEGEFCCSCWTKRTEPYVTPPPVAVNVSDEKKREKRLLLPNLADY